MAEGPAIAIAQFPQDRFERVPRHRHSSQLERHVLLLPDIEGEVSRLNEVGSVYLVFVDREIDSPRT